MFSYSKIEKGSFLIASPEVDSGIWFRSVLLICEHTAAGSFGLIVNQPLMNKYPEHAFFLDSGDSNKISMMTGGPLQSNQMMLLHNSSEIPKQVIEVCHNVYLGGDLLFLQDLASKLGGPSVRLCFGYSGWQGGQLEKEFLEGAWFVCPASHDFIFNTDHKTLWKRLLLEMGGKYACMSTIPEDLSMN